MKHAWIVVAALAFAAYAEARGAQKAASNAELTRRVVALEKSAEEARSLVRDLVQWRSAINDTVNGNADAYNATLEALAGPRRLAMKKIERRKEPPRED